MLAIPQALTEALLEDRARNLGVPVERGCAVTGLHESAGEMTVDVDGRRMTAAYVVGCDGPGSVVRREARIDFTGTGTRLVGLVADVVLDDPPPPGFSQVTAAGAVFVAPAPGGLFRIGGYGTRSASATRIRRSSSQGLHSSRRTSVTFYVALPLGGTLGEAPVPERCVSRRHDMACRRPPDVQK